MKSDIQSSSCYLLTAAYRKAHDLDLPFTFSYTATTPHVSRQTLGERDRKKRHLSHVHSFSGSLFSLEHLQHLRCHIVNWLVPFYFYLLSKKIIITPFYVFWWRKTLRAEH